VLGIDHRTLKRRLQEPVFDQAWEKGQAAGAVALRQLQWKHAKRLDSSGVAMTIHMSKHLLGQSDKALHLNLTAQDVDELIALLEKQRAQQLGADVGDTLPN
jgi:ABC-type transporter Mla MlaB component